MQKEGVSMLRFLYGPRNQKEKIHVFIPLFTCNGGQHPPECHAKYCRFLPSGVGGQLSPEYPNYQIKPFFICIFVEIRRVTAIFMSNMFHEF